MNLTRSLTTALTVTLLACAACGSDSSDAGEAHGSGVLASPCTQLGGTSECAAGLVCAPYRCGKAKIECDKEKQLQCLPTCTSTSGGGGCASGYECEHVVGDSAELYCHLTT